MSAIDALTVRPIPEVLRPIIFEQPAWTRLEPQSRSGDPTPGLEARLHDPLWLLGRQWQFGEFRGEDGGTPLGVTAAIVSAPITAFRAGDGATGTVRAWRPGELLDPAVEREPPVAAGPGVRQRAEAGRVLVVALAEAGLDARAGLLAHCPLLRAEDVQRVPRLFQTLALACPDAEQAAAALEAATSPPWLEGASDTSRAAASGWLSWYRGSVSPRDSTAECWVPQRLEHRFAIRCGSGEAQQVLEAPAFDGVGVEWYDLDFARGERLTVAGEPAAPAPQQRTLALTAAPLRFAGMPADRLWQFEDGSVNFGDLNVQPNDPARLCFVEFAMIYANDWFLVPVDVDEASLTRVVSLTYSNTFNEEQQITPADDTARSGRFHLFEMSVAGAKDSVALGLLMPPAARAPLAGRVLEDVLLLRDESAQMVWAVEATVQSPAGDPRSRRDEPMQAPPTRAMLPGAELKYTLETSIPPWWIPFVPIPTTGHGGFILRKATLTDRDQATGAVLAATPFDLQEEEVPREGTRVSRVPMLARGADGARLRWVARRVGTGRGEGSSGLAFDSAART